MTHEIQNFTFQNPTKILFGRNRIEDIDNEIPKDAKVLKTEHLIVLLKL